MRKINQKKLKKSLKKKSWKLMSLWVRLKSADENGFVKCTTCDNKYHWKKMHAGHLKHGVLDYDPMNINPQCVFCNQFQSGQRDLYYIWAVKTYGQDEVDKLYLRASMAKKGEFYSIEDLQRIALDLTVKISEICNAKKIKLQNFKQLDSSDI